MVLEIYDSGVMYPVGFRQDNPYAPYGGYADIDYDASSSEIQRLQAATSPPEMPSPRNATMATNVSAVDIWSQQQRQQHQHHHYSACGHHQQHQQDTVRPSWVASNTADNGSFKIAQTAASVRDLYPAEFYSPTTMHNPSSSFGDNMTATASGAMCGPIHIVPNANVPSTGEMVASHSTHCYYTPKTSSSTSGEMVSPNDDNSDQFDVTATENTSVNAARQTKAPFAWMSRITIPTATPGKTRTKDKYRLVYTETQKVELEKEYLFSHYISIQRKAELARSIGLSDRQVKIWFQNRRAKERKSKRTKHQQPDSPTMPFPSPPIQIVPNTTAAFTMMNTALHQQNRRLKATTSGVNCSLYSGAINNTSSQSTVTTVPSGDSMLYGADDAYRP